MPRYANNSPHWTWCDAGDPGAQEVVESALPPEGTYELTGGVLFDSAGVPTFQHTFTNIGDDDDD